MMPLPMMFRIIPRLVGPLLVGAVLFAWQLGSSEGAALLGAGVGAVLYAPVISRGKKNKWSWFLGYLVIGVFLILWGIELLGWATFPRA